MGLFCIEKIENIVGITKMLSPYMVKRRCDITSQLASFLKLKER